MTEKKKPQLIDSEIILQELKDRIKANNKYCQFNSCRPTRYMEGSNDTLYELVEFVEKKCIVNESIPKSQLTNKDIEDYYLKTGTIEQYLNFVLPEKMLQEDRYLIM